MFARLALVAALIVSSSLPTLADRRCAVPLADWQPREVLRKKLEAEGWTILNIRSDDGCYRVVARDGKGDTVKGRYDPATLQRLERRGRDHDGHGDHDDRDEHD